MEKKQITTYQTPIVRVIDVEFDTVFCISGNHEGTSEEDWDDLP